jgi:hypothetical protein
MMKKSSKLWPLLLLGITVLAVVLLAAGLSEFKLFPGGPFPLWIFGDFQSDDAPEEILVRPFTPPLNVVAILILLVMLVLAVWIIIFIIRPELRKYMLKRMMSYLLFLLLIYSLFSGIRRLNLLRQDETEASSGFFEQAMPGEAPPLAPTFIIDPPQWLVGVITLTLIALLLAVVLFFWQRRSHHDYQGPMELLVLEAQQAIETLQAGSDLKDTVLRCYREMSQVLSQYRGIKRQQAMTPREFEKHLGEIGLRDEHIRRLTRLFEEVRYGANISSERDKREAMDCLRAIVRAYGRSS